MVAIGAVVALVLLACDAYLKNAGSKFRTHVMPVAVGIYLPLGLSVPIFFGGLLAHWIKKRGEAARNRATLIGSGLIAGEAMGGHTDRWFDLWHGQELPGGCDGAWRIGAERLRLAGGLRGRHRIHLDELRLRRV